MIEQNIHRFEELLESSPDGELRRTIKRLLMDERLKLGQDSTPDASQCGSTGREDAAENARPSAG